MAAKAGRSLEVNEHLERVRDVLKSTSRKLIREAFDSIDQDHDACLSHLEVVRLIKMFLKGGWLALLGHW